MPKSVLTLPDRYGNRYRYRYEYRFERSVFGPDRYRNRYEYRYEYRYKYLSEYRSEGPVPVNGALFFPRVSADWRLFHRAAPVTSRKLALRAIAIPKRFFEKSHFSDPCKNFKGIPENHFFAQNYPKEPPPKSQGNANGLYIQRPLAGLCPPQER